MSIQRAFLQAILVWRYDLAPEKFQRLTKVPGSWVMVVPAGVDLPAFFKASALPEFGRLESHKLADGDTCYLAFPEEPQSHLPLE